MVIGFIFARLLIMMMNSRLYYIFTRSILIGMAVLVCLPCTAKRAFKQALDIPVAVVLPNEKANQAQSCSVTGDVTGKETVSGKQKLLLQKGWPVIDRSIPVLFITHFPLFNQLSSAVVIPLYILYRQYLI